MIIETHAHYDDEAFDEDRESLLECFPKEGIGRIINVGANMRGSESSVALAKRYPYVYAAVGVHPDDVEELDDVAMSRLHELCQLDKTVAVGEIGLDYYWHKEEEHQKLQQYGFRQQLAIAREEKLPFIIHSRDAAKDTFDIMKEEKAGDIGGVVHCFSYSVELAREYVKMGLYIGVGGVVTFKNARKLKDVVMDIPLGHIVLETDSPYMAPTPYRGKRNCSLYLPYVAEEIARLKNISVEEVITVTEQNAHRLFAKLQ